MSASYEPATYTGDATHPSPVTGKRRVYYCTGCCSLIFLIIGLVVLGVALHELRQPAPFDSVSAKRAIEPYVIELLPLIPNDPTEAEPERATELRDSIQKAFDDSKLSNAVLLIADSRGVQVEIRKGKLFKQNSVMWIASASKWVSSSVMMWLVDRNLLSLDDHPEKYLSWWVANDEHSNITLRHLLSFTSGYDIDHQHDCSHDRHKTLQECGEDIYETPLAYTPGSTYYYGGTHMVIAALMAENATGQNWNDIFNDFKLHIQNITGKTISDSFKYKRASTKNPWLAGGMDASTTDYNIFMQALFSGNLISNSSFQAMITDQIADASIGYSPVTDMADEVWHYGLGCWLECPLSSWDSPPCGSYNSNYNVSNVSYTVSSAGAFGYYPWINLDAGYYGIIGTSSLAEFLVRLIIAIVFMVLSVILCCVSCCLRSSIRKDEIPTQYNQPLSSAPVDLAYIPPTASTH